MEPSSDAITLRHVTKRYGALTAVSDLNLAVAPGEILGFLGPNGAGKTTTIRLLTGFLKPSSGEVRLLGHDMGDAAAALRARQRLGLAPDVAGLDADASGAWLLQLLARLQGQPAVDREEALAAMALSARDLQRPMGQLSRGTRQKINIVQAVQHRPDLLILDEPTEGLDPLTKRALFALLLAARERGATIFFSSHVLSDVEALCDRVALIRDGRLVAVDSINRLRANMQRRVTLQLTDRTDATAQLRAIPTVTRLAQRDGRYVFTVSDLPALLGTLAQLPVRDVVIEPPSLEEVFLHYYRPPDEVDA